MQASDVALMKLNKAGIRSIYNFSGTQGIGT
jgi:hypothetical protein